MAALSDSDLKVMAALLGGNTTGYYSPTVQATTPPPSSGAVAYSGAQPGLWYNPAAYDPNNPLSAINTLSGLARTQHGETYGIVGGGDAGEWGVTGPAVDYVTSTNGTILDLTPDGHGGYTFSDQYNDPTGRSDRDQIRVTYRYDPSTGTATPTAATPFYQPGDWVSTYRPVLQTAAPVVLAGLGGAYLGAGSTAGEGAGAVSGMDLAADAAVGSGNNIYTAGSVFGPGTTTSFGNAAGAVAGTNGASSPAAQVGTQIGEQSAAEAGGAGSIANTGSDAHFYNNPTAAEGGLGNMGGTGSPTIPTINVGTNPWGDIASSVGKWLAKNPSTAAGLATGLMGLGASASGGAFGGGGSLDVPNYNAAATAQGQSARMNQSNPWGSLTYTQTGTDALGNPIYSQNVSLNPQLQSNLNSAWTQQGNAINNLFGGATQDAAIKQAQDAAYMKQTGLLDPQYSQLKTQLDASLANQGIGLGSDAYKLAQDNFARQRDYAYGNARDSAIAQGNQMQQQLFGQNFQAATGLGNAVQSPTFASTPSATPYLQAAAFQGQGNLNQYNAKTGNQNSMMNGLFDLGGSLLSNPTFTNAIGNLFKTGG